MTYQQEKMESSEHQDSWIQNPKIARVDKTNSSHKAEGN